MKSASLYVKIGINLFPGSIPSCSKFITIFFWHKNQCDHSINLNFHEILLSENSITFTCAWQIKIFGFMQIY